VAAAGADIQGTADAFRYVYVPVQGDCAIVARVSSVQNVNPWAKAGVMLRESMESNAANAFLGVTPGNGLTWQSRAATGATTLWNNTAGLTAPYWVMLVRSGNTFTGYRSLDGANWTPQGSSTNLMLSTIYAGLALTSHTGSTLGTAAFDNVVVPGWTVLAPPIIGAQATAAGVTLSWPLTNADFAVQSCADLRSPNWQMVSSAVPQIVGGQWRVSLPLPVSSGSIYYRLSK